MGDELLQDVRLPEFASFLQEPMMNLWIGDGRTVGKLHFDPYENLLAMIAGRKRVTMFAPWRNEELYEGHIREAELTFERHSGTFSRGKLTDTTAMVMSPVDISRPNFTRYPLFK